MRLTRQSYVIERVAGLEYLGDRLATGHRLERDRPDELQGGPGKYYVNLRARLREKPGKRYRLVGGDPARDSEQDPP